MYESEVTTWPYAPWSPRSSSDDDGETVTGQAGRDIVLMQQRGAGMSTSLCYRNILTGTDSGGMMIPN